MFSTSSALSPNIAAIPPSILAPLIISPLFEINFNVSISFKTPAAYKELYSPKLCPATKSAFIPFSFNNFVKTTENSAIAGCAYFVFFSSSSVPSKITLFTSSLFLKISSINFLLSSFTSSYNFFPIPAY